MARTSTLRVEQVWQGLSGETVVELRSGGRSIAEPIFSGALYRRFPTGYNLWQIARWVGCRLRVKAPEQRHRTAKRVSGLWDLHQGRERSDHMPDRRYTSWVHGSSMQVEYPNRITAVRHTGPFVRIEGSVGQNTWIHLPVPTPTVVDGAALRVGSALVSFRTRSHAKVHEVIVYDGERRIAEHSGIDLRDSNLDARFDVPGNPEAGQGINITLGISFDEGAPDARSMQIEVVGAGIEFSA